MPNRIEPQQGMCLGGRLNVYIAVFKKYIFLEKNAPYEVSDSFVVGYESAGGFPYYEGAGQNPYLQNQHKPKFSTFMDDQSDTSSMSTALLNGHLSPHFDTFASSAQNTLERSRQNTLERKAHNNP